MPKIIFLLWLYVPNIKKNLTNIIEILVAVRLYLYRKPSLLPNMVTNLTDCEYILQYLKFLFLNLFNKINTRKIYLCKYNSNAKTLVHSYFDYKIKPPVDIFTIL